MRAKPSSAGEGPWKVDVGDLVEKTLDKESSNPKAYLPFIREGIKTMIESGFRFPFIKKATSPTSKFQLTGHLHIHDALQGYWERNKNVYTHRAKSDYRALYIGTIAMLEEEKILTGYDTSKEITKLEMFLKEKEYRHKTNQDVSMLKSEIRTCLQERTSGDITADGFEDQMEELIKMYAKSVSEDSDSPEYIKAVKLVEDTILEEEKKAGNRGRTQTWRERQKNALGISVVSGDNG